MKICLYALIQMIANLIQAISGFAGGPLAMPPSMQLVGIETAKSSITLLFLISTSIVAIQNRNHFNRKIFSKMLLIMMLGFLPGIWLFNQMPKQLILIIYGIIVMLIGIWKLFSPNQSNRSGILGYLALILSGALQGMFTSGGPFAVIYASSVMKDKNEFRGTISAIWAILNLYMVLTMFRQGLYNGETVKLTVCSIIPVFGAIYAGNRITAHLDPNTFHRFVCILLIISGGLLLLNNIG